MAESEEVEQLRRRARRRLVGAAAIVLFLVVVPPLFMDLEPKPVSSNLSVEIPSPSAVRADRKPESTAPAPATSLPGGSGDGSVTAQSNPNAAAAPVPGVPAPPSGLAERAGGGAQLPVKQGAPELPTSRPDPRLARSAESGPQVPTGAEAPAKNGSDAQSGAQSPAKSGSEAADLQAASTKSAAPPGAKGGADAQATDASQEMYFIALGTFAERHNARQLMHKANRLGVKVYAEEIAIASGHRTRVRAGPFSSREAAEKARKVLRKSGIQASAVQHGEQRG